MTLNYDNGIASLTHIIIGRTIDVAKGQHNFGKVKTTNSSFLGLAISFSDQNILQILVVSSLIVSEIIHARV